MSCKWPCFSAIMLRGHFLRCQGIDYWTPEAIWKVGRKYPKISVLNLMLQGTKCRTSLILHTVKRFYIVTFNQVSGQDIYLDAATANTTALNNSTTATNQAAGEGQPHNNLQPYLVCHYIIKYWTGIRQPAVLRALPSWCRRSPLFPIYTFHEKDVDK